MWITQNHTSTIKNIEPVINSLEQSVNLLFNRFKGNDGKCHVLFNIDEFIFTVF